MDPMGNNPCINGIIYIDSPGLLSPLAYDRTILLKRRLHPKRSAGVSAVL